MSITFNKYSSIENSYREKYIEIIRFAGLSNVKWHISEKIDGANFQFICDGAEVKVASRNNLVGGTFFGCQAVIDKHADKMMLLKNEFYPEAEQIAVYGELYGPGIQKRVNYGPDKGFAAFDLQVDGVPADLDVMVTMLATVEIPLVPSMGVFDTLDLALAFTNDFDSRLFLVKDEESGMMMPVEGNITEGSVLQPLKTTYTDTGSRVLIKNKNDKFSEKIPRKDRPPRAENPMVGLVIPYINENRMLSVISKEGELTPKDFGRIIKLMGADVLTDMIADGELPENWKTIDELKPVGKAVASTVAAFLKQNLLPRL